jgi:hypothetical protein
VPDLNIGQIAATVWEKKIGKKPTDNIFNSRAFFFSLNKNGFKEVADGGRVFELGVEFAENTTRIDTFDAARFDPKIAAGSVVFTELERLRAQARMGKYDLIEEKMENGKDSHIADLNRQFLGDGSAANDVDGVQYIISATPTTGTVGGINAGTFSVWRNRQNSGAQSVSAYNQCSLGGIKNTPRWVCTGRASFQGYEQILVAIEQIESMRRKREADIAFDNEMLKFKGAYMYYDEDAPAGNAYLYNNTNLKVAYYKGGWMKMYPARDPHNQLSRVHKVATYCNMVTNARRHLGVVTAIS